MGVAKLRGGLEPGAAIFPYGNRSFDDIKKYHHFVPDDTRKKMLLTKDEGIFEAYKKAIENRADEIAKTH